MLLEWRSRLVSLLRDPMLEGIVPTNFIVNKNIEVITPLIHVVPPQVVLEPLQIGLTGALLEQIHPPLPWADGFKAAAKSQRARSIKPYD